MEELVRSLIEEGVLKTGNIISAFRSIDRRDFILPGDELYAYIDTPLQIGQGQTISQPYTVAFMMELLRPKMGEKILDVGSGSGWTTALLAHIVGEKGYVIGLELIPELVTFGSMNLAKYNFKQATIAQAEKKLGKSKDAPYDKILVSAGNQEVPQELLDQLKVGGILVIPILDAIWKIVKVNKTKSEIEKFEGFTFVPLIYDQ